MELLDSDLHRIIQSPQPLEDAHFKHFMFQLLRGLRFAHSYGIVHRDLKPANLLVTKACDLVISDFGLARQMPEGDGPMTEVRARARGREAGARVQSRARGRAGAPCRCATRPPPPRLPILFALSTSSRGGTARQS